MVTTELSALATLDLWRQAGSHVLYSLSLGMGTTITFSSYKAGSLNCVRVASCVALVNLVTSMLTTAIIFVVLGFWATTSGSVCVKKNVLMLTKLILSGVLPKEAKTPENILLMPPQNYLDWINDLPPHLQYQIIHHALPCSIKVQTEKLMEGPGLAYAAFSQAVSLLPGSSFWAIVFFLALLITELGALIRILEGIILPLQYNVSIFKKYPSLAPVLVCLGSFLSSLIFSSHSGSYIMSLFNDQLVPVMLIIIVTFQNMALTWIYGTRRFREELYGQLGCMQWPTFSFLWSYVTLPGLLVLLIICIMKLHQKVTPSYIAWNSSVSQEVTQPYLKRSLGWVTFFSILTFLPILAHPLHHWWYTQDPVISDTLEKQMSFKQTSKVPPRSIKWPKRSLEKSTLVPQHKGSESSLKETTCPPAREGHLNSWWRKNTQSSSWLSLHLATSSFSMWSNSLAMSRQGSLASTAVESGDIIGETIEEKLPDKSDQSLVTAPIFPTQQIHPITGSVSAHSATGIIDSTEKEGKESKENLPSNL
ncbi:orphan sodium- and chloride-dependent neurotransmitter transporter NTT5-like [Nycticebus coucang]|uniref:orphan sodium- and chloride-dependent neurotransmitter transporter NTT5-like n=1 Tax=Nycticebus coucang TaxID=9470 RepID=UPI00234CAD2D|nr:orphan sodium- and chloride-dependent neurotransmitter transporter NTT5-like [Nycticebus coucang]